MSLVRFAYTLLYSLLIPFVLLRLWWRGRSNPGYRQRVLERFGQVSVDIPAGCLWVHSVSVGETIAAAPLVRAFQQRHPNQPVLITTTTPTGSEQVTRLYGDSVFHSYLPYDLPYFIRRFINRVQPQALVIMETELWPNLLVSCQQCDIPVLLANARLSARSARGYGKVSGLTRPMLGQLAGIAAQYPADANRFIELGAPANNVSVVGSIKFDIDLPSDCLDKGQMLRQQWGVSRPVLAMASSHPGEDELVISLLPTLQKAVPDLLLLLIPRHPERFDPVFDLACRAGNTVRRSHSLGHDKTVSTKTEIYVADTMGEMLTLLASADLVLMGGSLIPHGGHNPVEPAALGRATVIGPHYHNFQSMVDALLAADGCQLVDDDGPTLAQQLVALLTHPEQLKMLGEKGFAMVDQQRGAGERILQLLDQLMLKSS